LLFGGAGERSEVDLTEWNLTGQDGEKLGKVTGWRPKAEGWGENRGLGKYMSINGYTIDADQEGFDLRELTEMKAVEYLDCLELTAEERDPRVDRPFENGAY
jgi:hypothetical protein